MPSDRNSASCSQYRPQEYKLSLSALASLPRRFCRPPVADVERKRRSVIRGVLNSAQNLFHLLYATRSTIPFSLVLPIYNVQLDDILRHRYLPPLSLKDFEEYLLYVEGTVEDIYFLLWLDDYSQNFARWTAASRRAPTIASGPSRPIPSASVLLASYIRAKRTFLTPGIETGYTLRVPDIFVKQFSDTALLHTPQLSTSLIVPPPDPSLFEPLRTRIHDRLQCTLNRFVSLSYCNMGNGRRCIGMTGAIALGILSILVIALAKHRSLRFVAVPCLWLSAFGWILSNIGICALLWCFGDLRQLRAFELERPPITDPKPVKDGESIAGAIHKKRSHPASGELAMPAYSHGPINLPHVAPPPLALTRSTDCVRSSTWSRTSITSSSNDDATSSPAPLTPSSHLERHLSCESRNSISSMATSIHISPAFYDGHEPVDENVPSFFHSATLSERRGATPIPQRQASIALSTFAPTATFIPVDEDADVHDIFSHPSLGASQSTSQIERGPRFHSMSFDFGKLPFRRRSGDLSNEPKLAWGTFSEQLHTARTERKASSTIGSSIVSRIRRSLSNTSLVHPRIPNPGLFAREPQEKGITSLAGCPRSSLVFTDSDSSSNLKAQSQSDKADPLRRVWSVGAFTAPVTRVREPLVARAQWEIIVRTIAWSTFISWILVGVLWALPLRP